MRFGRVVFWLLVVGLLVPALTLTAVRLIQPDVGLWVRAVSFTPLAIPLYAALVLLPGVRLLAPSGQHRAPYVVGLVLALAPLVLHGWWVSPLFIGPNPPPAADAEPFTVMTANLAFGEADPVALVEVAARSDVTVLILAEVTPDALRGMEEAGLAIAFPHRAGTPASGAAGTMVLSTARLSDVRPVSTAFDSLAVTVRLAGGAVRLLAVHPQPPLGSTEGWRQDHRVVVARAGSPDEPDVIAGDFNATLDHEPMTRLRDLGFASAAELVNSGWAPTWPDNGNVGFLGVPLPRLVQIDHVLVNGSVAALSTETIPLDDSDHRAVVARLALK